MLLLFFWGHSGNDSGMTPAVDGIAAGPGVRKPPEAGGWAEPR
jgi:hypothetical protein